MIIVSQDKTKITEKLELSVIENEIYFERGVLGTYQTKERAKEVLNEIIETIKAKSNIVIDTEGIKTEFTGNVYEMPKEWLDEWSG